MSVTIVGTTSQQVTGASSITVTPHGSAIAGDLLLFLHVAFRPSGSFTVTPDAQVEAVANFFNVTAGAAYWTYYDGSSTYTFSYSQSNIYADLLCVVIRGFRSTAINPLYGQKQPIPFMRTGFINHNVSSTATTGVIPMGDVSTTTDSNILFSFGWVLSNSSYALPGELSTQWTSALTDGTITYHNFFATTSLASAGNHAISEGSRTTTQSFEIDWCVICPDDAVEDEFYTDGWQNQTFSFSVDKPLFIVDNNGPYVYHVYNSSGSAPWHVDKINRNTLAIEVAVTLAYNSRTNQIPASTQDDDSIYITGRSSGVNYILRIAKADLTVTTTYTATGLVPIALAVGQGWNDGKIWALDNQASQRVRSWNIVSGSAVDALNITGTVNVNYFGMAIDAAGDIFITAGNGSSLYERLVKVSSALTASIVYTFDGFQGERPILKGDYWQLTYDAVDGNLLMLGSNTQGRLIKLSTSGTIAYDVERLPWTAPESNGNSFGLLANFEAVRSLAIGEEDAVNVTAATLNRDGSLVILDASDLSYIRTIRVPLIQFRPHNVRIDPEGRLWGLLANPPSDGSFYLAVWEGATVTLIRPLFGRGHGWRNSFDGQ